jgi:hypothetical protein
MKTAFGLNAEESEYEEDSGEMGEDLLQNGDPEGLEEDGPTTTTTGGANTTTILTPFVDQNGLTRIGPQPLAPAVYIKWAPRKEAFAKVGTNCRASYSDIDKKINASVTLIAHTAEMVAMQDKLKRELVEDAADSGKVTRLCDYTGVQISWGPGPEAISMEAIYPYIVLDGRVAYHSARNICTVTSSLNWAKGKSAPIFLPLLATWLAAHDTDMEFKERIRRWAWTFNALSNAAHIAHIYHLRSQHQIQVGKWTQWSPMKQREILEVLRTGTKTTQVADDLATMDVKDLFSLRVKKLRSCA